MMKFNRIRTHTINQVDDDVVSEEHNWGQLEPIELQAVSIALEVIHNKEMELSVLRAGLSGIWAEFRLKYNWPAEFSYDPKTGKIGPLGEY